MSAEPPLDTTPLREGAVSLGIALDDAALTRFTALTRLLLEWNARFNLTAITDPAAVLRRHMLDSLTCVMALDAAALTGSPRVLDVGSGAGFPGLPLAIAFPHWQVTLLEATEKKVGFQREAVTALGLANVSPQAGRSEAVARDPRLRGQFDVVTARALAALPTLLEYCCPFAVEGGQVIALKQGDVTEELRVGRRAAFLLGAELSPPLPVTLPQLPAGRCVVAARQMRPCPAGYPRAGGAPRKKPLGMAT